MSCRPGEDETVCNLDPLSLCEASECLEFGTYLVNKEQGIGIVLDPILPFILTPKDHDLFGTIELDSDLLIFSSNTNETLVFIYSNFNETEIDFRCPTKYCFSISEDDFPLLYLTTEDSEFEIFSSFLKRGETIEYDRRDFIYKPQVVYGAVIIVSLFVLFFVFGIIRSTPPGTEKLWQQRHEKIKKLKQFVEWQRKSQIKLTLEDIENGTIPSSAINHIQDLSKSDLVEIIREQQIMLNRLSDEVIKSQAASTYLDDDDFEDVLSEMNSTLPPLPPPLPPRPKKKKHHSRSLPSDEL